MALMMSAELAKRRLCIRVSGTFNNDIGTVIIRNTFSGYFPECEYGYSKEG